MAADTGQGATLLLSVTGAVGCVRSMQLPDWTMEKVDSSCLDTTGFMAYVPGDLTDPGDIVCEVVFDALVGVPDNGVIETITVTFPPSVAGNTPATLTGTGFITSTTLPNMAINELMTLGLTISFDGETGPAFTAEVTP